MTYFVQCWIKDGVVISCMSDTHPILINHMPEQECDFRIVAEVQGEYMSSDYVISNVSYDGVKLIGLDFICQEKLDGFTLPYELKARIAITTRNALLVTGDWTQLPDARAAMGAEKAAEWDAYRQALRDITKQPGFPADIVWPVKPA